MFFQDEVDSTEVVQETQEDTFSLEEEFKEIQNKELKGYELLSLRKHYSSEVRNLASMIGNPLEKVDFIELDDFLGIEETKALKLSLVRLKNLKYGDFLEITQDD